jgi:hypothetical protein
MSESIVPTPIVVLPPTTLDMNHTTTTRTTETTTTAPTSGVGAPTTTGASAGAGLGAKIKCASLMQRIPNRSLSDFALRRGAAQLVHGMGERLRGNALDAADAATGDRTADAGHVHHSGVTTGAQNASVDRKGLREEEAGMANMQSGGTSEFLHCRKLSSDKN